MVRTQAQIQKRALERQKKDYTGWEWTMYVDYLDYDRARKLVPKITKEEWQQGHDVAASKPLMEVMRAYLPFAEKKAAEGRNLSAQRSLWHYVAWFWLAGNDEMAQAITIYMNSGQYRDYGKEMLGHIEQVIAE